MQAVRARLQGDKDGLQADNAKLYADNDALRSEKDDLQDEKGDLQFNLATEQGRVQSLEASTLTSRSVCSLRACCRQPSCVQAELGAMEDELQDTLFAHEGSSLQLQRKNVEVLTANNKNRDLVRPLPALATTASQPAINPSQPSPPAFNFSMFAGGGCEGT